MTEKALVIIDLQVGLETKTKKLFQLQQVLKKVNLRIKSYRERDLPIIFIQHEDEELLHGTDSWQLFPELEAKKEDYYVSKKHANSFFHTELSKLLEGLSVDTLEICGAQTEFCVDTTIRFAHGLGYKIFMQKGTATTLDNDNWTAEEIIQHHETIWNQRFLLFFD
ncbi:cysteine hydrolase family protein [Enterococcus sp. LJL128]